MSVSHGTAWWSTVDDTPVGPVRLLTDTDGRLVRVDLLPGEPPPGAAPAPPGTHAGLHDALRAYLAGRTDRLDAPVRLDGTEFQRAVWAALMRIPRGATRSYGEIAAEIGRPGASRAVGSACGRNPVPLCVPCHRVLAAGGRPGGWSGGDPAHKALLLELEGVSLR